ncbi:hypothetical protein AJ80_07650 [Polytolypa hystricis UAMH7299]|uniref:phospholipase D n=1 Tax=Polytolypa hystricis (strain UAMH7299) TaxID=1447883 RepID=A0A2B7XM71_POLH7|nr:hypothetical protein AJ80_07650 [Polytolypa hystricis UAMH7299]
MAGNNDHLAYGQLPGQKDDRREDSDRSLLGSAFGKIRNKYNAHQGQPQQQQQQQQQQTYNPQGGYSGPPPSQPYQQPFQSGSAYQGSNQAPPYGADPTHGQNPDYHSASAPTTSGSKPPKMVAGLLGKIQGIGADVVSKIGTSIDPQAYAQYGPQSSKPGEQNRHASFAPVRDRNDAKWYIDGCSYMWAVSRALETAKESIWILDWWLSPELYLRRPPAKNEQYRLDRMLQAAAQRGVKVNIIVYKEVTQAMTISSSHTKHALQDLHPNIAVLRHPDHLPDRQTIHSSVVSSFQNMTLSASGLAKMSGDALKGLYGMHEGVVLYWAHHEKLCLIDGKTAFMGGLDLCYGRWDTYQSSIADVHPNDLKDIVFPGQDYNNGRIMDFHDVRNWENNQLDRKTSSRMGWADVSVSLHGPVVEDLRKHFVERWNVIYDEKYAVRKDSRHQRLVLYARPLSSSGGYGQGTQGGQQQQGQQPQQPQQQQQQQQHGQQQQTGYSPSGPGSYSPQPQGQYAALQQPTPEYSQPPKPSSQSPQPQGQYTTQQQPTPEYSQTPGPGPQSPQPQGQYTSQQQQTPEYSQPQGQYTAQQQPTPEYSQAPGLGSQSPQPQGQYGGQQFPPPPPGPPPAQSPYGGGYQPPGTQSQQSAPYFPPPPGQNYQDPQHSQHRGVEGYGNQGYQQESRDRGITSELRGLKDEVSGFGRVLRGQLAGQVHQYQDKYFTPPGQQGGLQSRMSCQILRSSSKWSHGGPTEISIQDAYVKIIRESEHFVYIENQFFITATSDEQKPVKNKIGAAIVERILRAARAGQKYKIYVVIPSVPGFAGDLHDDASLGTRAIMEFQYFSINRGGYSIMEMIAKEGFNPMEYIRFYNLRNYDRINASGTMRQAEQKSGVDYEDARKAHDAAATGQRTSAFDTTTPFPQYQQAAQQVSTYSQSVSGRWNTVSSCYMLGGEDIRKVPWEYPGDISEIDAFVSEELYVHSKVLIADDRTVICGSANINDRSQLGERDSEIAVIIQDETPLQSTMNGQPWPVSHFAATLRRQLCRKHLGLLYPQDYSRPEANFEPVGVPNEYDMNSPEDQVVADPLSDAFLNLWNTRAKTNTEVYRKVFHAVPDDTVRTWNDYKEFYEYYFRKQTSEGGNGKKKEENQHLPPRYEWGHVIRDDFPEGVQAVKEELSKVKGTIVEMPLMFLIDEDIAQEGLGFNSITQLLYT